MEGGQALVLLGPEEGERCHFLRKQSKNPARGTCQINDSYLGFALAYHISGRTRRLL